MAENNHVLRLFKYFYRVRPTQRRYLTFWPVEQLLSFLKTWHPINELSLKQLTLKTIALIALTSSDRGQTLHYMNIEHTHIKKDAVSFIIFDRLKTTKRVAKPKEVNCVQSNTPSLNVCDYVLAYMNRTFSIRADTVRKGHAKPTQLFLSWATHRPVSKPTISRWLSTVLALSGIDTNQFKAHSFRGAGLSNALEKGASVQQIIQAGDWTNVQTFNSYYNAPSTKSSIGKLILDQVQDAVSINWKNNNPNKHVSVR